MNTNSKILLVILILLLFSSLYSNEIKPGISLLKSAVLPGWGEVSAGNKIGYVFMASEVLLWSSKFYFIQEAKLKDKQSFNYAIKHAGIDPSSNYDDDFFYHLSRYDSYGYSTGGYNLFIVEQAESLYPDSVEQQNEYIQDNAYNESHFWEWEDNDVQYDYSIMRKRILEYNDYSQALTGAIIANHLVSAITSLISSNKRKRRSEFGIFPDSKMNINIIYSYKF
jgi:hypothetical protein